MQTLDCVEATVKYLYNDVKSGSLPNGYRGLFQAYWFIDDIDRFYGQYAMMPACGGHWIPSSELTDIVYVDSDKFYNAQRKAMHDNQ